MAWMDEIGSIVSRYASGGGAAAAPADPREDYSNIAQSAPPQVMADALAHTFRSDQTPAFPEMVSNLFQQSNADQRAGLLNRLMGTLGPAALASAPALQALASKFLGGERVTTAQAAQVSPDQVQEFAGHALNHNPSIIDEVSGFYSQHPDLVKGIGAAALGIAIRHIAQRV